MNWLLALFLLPLLFFLPGYSISRAIFRDANQLSAGERVYIPVALSICFSLWVGLTLAAFGWFSIPALSAAALVLTAVPLFFRKQLTAWSFRDLRPDWVVLAILALATLLFAHPAEYVLGNTDAGTYVNVGANIARTGAIAIYDAQVQTLPPDPAKTFYWQLINPYMLYNQVRLPGFFVADQARGLVLPQFLHLYPVWLAIWNALFGIEIGLYATPLIALLGSSAFYLVARSIWNKTLARLALFLLVILVPQFWFARYPVAEGLTQMLVLTGMLAVIRFERARDGAFGFPLLGGLAFGLVFMTRADAILLLLPLSLYALALVFLRAWRREHWLFFGSLVLVTAHAIAHMLVFAPNYLYFQYSHALRMKNLDKLLPGGLPKADELFSRVEYLLILVGAVALGALLLVFADRVVQWARARWSKRTGEWFVRNQDVLRAAASIVVIGAALFAYMVYPQPGTPYAYVGGETPLKASANLIKFGWYFSPIGIALALLGAAVVIRNDLARWNVFFFGTAGLFTVFYLEELYSNPHYIYTMRHYIPLVIPLFVLCAARALDWLWHWSSYAQLGRVLAGSAFTLWMLYNLYAMGIVDASRAQGVALRLPLISQSVSLAVLRLEPIQRAIVGTKDLAGATTQVKALASMLDPNAVVVFSNNRDEPAALATPLRFVHGRDAFVTVFNNPPGDKVAGMIDQWRANGRDVVLAFGTNGGKLSIPGYGLQRIGNFTLDVPQWAFAYDFMPRAPWRVHLSYGLYRAVPTDAPPQLPFVLDMGGDDFPWLVRGFMERPPEERTRWFGELVSATREDTTPRSVSGTVRVPLSSTVDALRLNLRARAPRENVRLVVKSGSKVLGEARLSTQPVDYSFEFETGDLRREGDTVLLEFASEATPDGAGRLLGAGLERLVIEQAE